MSIITVKVSELCVGDAVDLENDPYADPNSTSANHIAFECEYQTVREIEQETINCICVYFDFDAVGFPPDHELKVFR